MTITATSRKQIQYPTNAENATANKAWVDAVTAACNGTLPAGFLSADTEGRAAMATDYFNEATATAKFADGAITTALLKAGILSADATGRALFAAGVIDATTAASAIAADALVTSGLTIAKRTVTVNDEDPGMTGASYAVNIGAALPANAIVLAHEINIVEQFAGEADTTIIIGGTDTDAIVASTDLDALAPGKYQATLGVHPRGSFSSEQLVATFAATALEDLSAGQAIITVWYSVLA